MLGGLIRWVVLGERLSVLYQNVYLFKTDYLPNIIQIEACIQVFKSFIV